MKIIVSGGTGFIGGRVVERFKRDDHYVAVYSRKPGLEKRTGIGSYFWDPLGAPPSEDSLENMNAVIHLAGEPVAQRWNNKVKQRIRDSRVLGTRNLVAAIGRTRHKPTTLVSASAIGIYGDRADEKLTEESLTGDGFLADVCREWEAEADRATEHGLRVVKLRIGFVLGRDGGALKEMLPAFRAGVAGRLGFSGKQWMPWIHVDDLCGLIHYAAMNENVSGVWNATAPNPVRNREFTRQMGIALHRPTLFPAPAPVLRVLFGELAEHMLDSVRVVPEAAEAAGFPFQYPTLAPALRNLLA
jgi:uncharacterized protein (TIGR01777 family)